MNKYVSLREINPPNRIKYILNPDYLGGDFLGKGTFGDVYRGYTYDKDKPNYKGKAIEIKKILLSNLESKNLSVQNTIQQEAKIFNKLNENIKGHQNLITIHDIFQTKNNLYIVMELCEK